MRKSQRVSFLNHFNIGYIIQDACLDLKMKDIIRFKNPDFVLNNDIMCMASAPKYTFSLILTTMPSSKFR